MGAVADPYRPAPASWQAVSQPDDVYPTDALQGSDTALVLFSARWFGRQDAYFVAEAGLTATCVDSDGPRLREMQTIYPAEWEFSRRDVWDFCRYVKRLGETWDTVSLDPFTQLFDRCAQDIVLWCSLARRAVILGTGATTQVTAPKGWKITQVLKRSDYDGGVYWTVLKRA